MIHTGIIKSGHIGKRCIHSPATSLSNDTGEPSPVSVLSPTGSRLLDSNASWEDRTSILLSKISWENLCLYLTGLTNITERQIKQPKKNDKQHNHNGA